MSATYIGSASVQTEITCDISSDGKATYTEKYLYLGNQSVSVPSLGQTISVGGLSDVKSTSSELVDTNGAFRELTIKYSGTDNSGGGGGGGGASTFTTEAVGTTTEEPIETNYNFLVGKDGSPAIVTFAGGTSVRNQDLTITVVSGNGASEFDSDGTFVGFRKNANEKLFGVTSYLNPALAYRRSFTTTTKPDLSKVGRIVNPSADFPAVQASRSWLCVSITYRQNQSTFEVTQEFRASDLNGWNEYIYGAPVDPPSAP